MIFVLGDSHASFFSGREYIIPEYPDYSINGCFQVYRLGAPLAYSLGKENTFYKARTKIQNLLNTTIKSGDKILFVFGEIDCRYHIITQARKQDKPYLDIVRDCVFNYILGIQSLNIPSTIEIAVWGPIPSTTLNEWKGSKDNPIAGTPTERNFVTDYFNQFLENSLKGTEIKFFSIYKNLIDRGNRTLSKYYMDDIHLSPTKVMVFALHELGDWVV